MPSRNTRIPRRLTLSATLLLFLVGSSATARAQTGDEQAAAKTQPATTNEKDRTDLSVTVYNSNLALVRDVREIHLESGVFPLRFEDVAASIMPATVHFRSLTDPAKLDVIEQDYEYDLLDPAKLLQKYVGRELMVTYALWAAGELKWPVTKAVLLADNNGGTVWKIGDEIVTNAQPYSFPDLPGNLYSRPTLVWTLENHGDAEQRVEASYLTNDMNWSADYVLTVARDEKSADLDGWVTLDNKSGVAYTNARLQLVAGEIHRAEPPMAAAGTGVEEKLEAKAAPQFQQEAFSEYHLYTLGRRTSIQNNESKQISLLSGSNVPVEKYLTVEGETDYYRNPQGIGDATPEPVEVFFRFKNDEKSGLGMPLPAGTVRVYQADSKGGLQFAGEDTINHTPKDETLKIYTGNAFDVVCERKQTDYKKLENRLYELEYQITLRNHKDGPVTVEVREPVGGDWQVLNSNFKWTKLDASTIGFEIPVDKDGTATLDYRVQVKW